MATFKGGTRYRLLDPQRYDDEMGEGYAWAESVQGADGSRIADCWICNDRGEVHPGYDACPVPILFEDLDGDSAEPGLLEDRDPAGPGWG